MDVFVSLAMIARLARVVCAILAEIVKPLIYNNSMIPWRTMAELLSSHSPQLLGTNALMDAREWIFGNAC